MLTFIEQEKEERRARDNEEKSARKEEKRLGKEKRKSLKSDSGATPATQVPQEAAVDTAASAPAVENEPAAAEPATAERGEHATPPNIRTSMEDQASLRIQEITDAANKNEVTPIPPSSPNGTSKVKDWLKNKFNHRASKTQKSSPENKETGFVGGAALTGASITNPPGSVVEAPVASVGDEGANAGGVALASEDREPSQKRESVASAPSSVLSSVQSAPVEHPVVDNTEVAEGDDAFQEARENFDKDLAPPPSFAVENSSSPVRAGKFTEDI